MTFSGSFSFSTVCRYFKGSAVRDFSYLAFSTGLFQLANLGMNLAMARFFGPTKYGDWSALMVLANYLAYLQFGVLNGMNRDVPLYTGRGASKHVERIQRTALGGIGVSALVGALLLLVIPPERISNTIVRSEIFALALYFVAFQLYSYVATYCRSRKKFDLFSLQQSLFGFGLIIVVIPLAIVSGLTGSIWGQSIVVGLVTLVVAGIGRVRPGISLSFRDWLALVRVGFPIMIVGVGYLVLTTMDRWVVLSSLGSEALGYYSFQVRLLSFSPLFAGLVAEQVYPRAAEAYGRTQDPRDLVPYLRKQVIAVFGLSLLASLFLLLLVPIIVNRFMPAYSESLKAMPFMLIGMFLLPQTAVFGIFLNIVDKQVRYMLTQICVILLGFGITIGLTNSALGLVGTAIGTMVTYAVYLVALIVVCGNELRKATHRKSS